MYVFFKNLFTYLFYCTILYWVCHLSIVNLRIIFERPTVRKALCKTLEDNSEPK